MPTNLADPEFKDHFTVRSENKTIKQMLRGLGATLGPQIEWFWLDS